MAIRYYELNLVAFDYVSLFLTCIFAVFYLVLHLRGPTWLIEDRRRLVALFEPRERLQATIWAISLVFFNAVLVIYKRGVSLQNFTLTVSIALLIVSLAATNRHIRGIQPVR